MYQQLECLNEAASFLRVLLKNLEFHKHRIDDDMCFRLASAVSNANDVIEEVFRESGIKVDYDLIERSAAEKKPSHYVELNIASHESVTQPKLPPTLNRFELMVKIGEGTGVFGRSISRASPIEEYCSRYPRIFNSFMREGFFEDLKQHTTIRNVNSCLSLLIEKTRLLKANNEQTQSRSVEKTIFYRGSTKMTIGSDHPFIVLYSLRDKTALCNILYQELYLRKYRNFDRNIYLVDGRFLLFIRNSRISLLDTFILPQRKMTEASKSQSSDDKPQEKQVVFSSFLSDPLNEQTEAMYYSETDRYLYSVSVDGSYSERKFQKFNSGDILTFDNHLDSIAKGHLPVKGYEEYTAICAAEGLVAAAAFNTALFKVRLSVASALEGVLVTSCYFRSENPIHFMQLVRHEDALLLVVCDYQGCIKTFIFHNSKLIESCNENVLHVNALEASSVQPVLSYEAFSEVRELRTQNAQMHFAIDLIAEHIMRNEAKLELLKEERHKLDKEMREKQQTPLEAC